MTHKLIKTDNYLLVVDNSEIKEGKTFLTKEGIIHNNIGWNYGDKVIIAHLPLNGSPILEGVPLLPPYSRHQEDGLEELGNRMFRNKIDSLEEIHSDYILGVTEGYQVAREKYKYTEGDMRKAITMARDLEDWQDLVWEYEYDDIIQSLHQYPTEFETEDVLTPSQIFYPNDVPYSSPKTITTAQGIQWVGKYL